MGNFCTTPSSMEWAGDDWGSLTSKNKRRMSSSKVFDEEGHHGLNLGKVEKERLLGALRASSDASGMVKIKISKKELAELLGGTEKHDEQIKITHARAGHASAQQVLVRLMNARDHDAHHTHWRPVLQSIPEVN